MSTSSRAARLQGRYGPFRGLAAESESRITIGRGSGNDLILSAPEVSKRHAEVARRPDGAWILTDLESSNGTFVDGRQLNGSCTLGDVAVLGFGGAGELVFQQVNAGVVGTLADQIDTVAPPDQTLADQDPEFLAGVLDRLGVDQAASPDRTAVGQDAPALPGVFSGEPAGSDPEAAVMPSPTGAADRSGGVRKWVLEVDSVDGESVRFELGRGSHTLGRGSTVDLRVPNEHLSREHARIEVGDLVAIEDLGSSNHTFVDGRRIEGRVELPPGAQLTFGEVRARLLEVEV